MQQRHDIDLYNSLRVRNVLVDDNTNDSDAINKLYADTADTDTLNAAKLYTDTLVGDIAELLDELNGEVI